MNAPLDDHLPSSERFIDAALTEHARLGSDRIDEELIHRILRDTVNRHGATRQVIGQSTREWRMWMTGGALVAALVTLLLVILSTLEVDQKGRQSDEFRFLVTFSKNPEIPEVSVDPALPIRETELYDAPLALIAPTSRGNTDSAPLTGSYELITSPGPSLELTPSDRSWLREESFRITANLSRVSAEGLIYEGDVVVDHPLFRIEARKVSVHVPGNSRSGSSQPLMAHGVKLTQKSPGRLAVAEELSFDPISGRLTLTGVKALQTSEGKLRAFAPGDRLVLDGERFTVESPHPIMKYASPTPVRP